MKCLKPLPALLVMLFCMQAAISQTTTPTVKKVTINGSETAAWDLYPGSPSIVRVQTDSPVKDANLVLFLGQYAFAKVKPLPLSGTGNILTYKIDFANDDQSAAWKALYNSYKKNKANVDISVGPESGIPFGGGQTKTVRFISQWGDTISWISGIILLGIFFYLLFGTNVLREPCITPPCPVKKPFSLSRIQFAIWNLLILFAVIYIYSNTLKLLPLTTQLLGLLGISGGQYMIGFALTKPTAVNQVNTTSGNLAKDMATSDVGSGLHRVQNILWSVAIWIYFLYTLIITIDYPVLDAQLLILTGFTAAIYAFGKSKEEGKMLGDAKAKPELMTNAKLKEADTIVVK